MISLQTELQGKRSNFGYMQKKLKKYGFFLCGAWEYDRGKFDAILWREKDETIYLRMPFHVISGELDKHNANIEFRTPYIIKHIVNLGLERDANSLLTATGFNQFQKPLDEDAVINNKDRWERYSHSLIKKIISHFDFHLP